MRLHDVRHASVGHGELARRPGLSDQFSTPETLRFIVAASNAASVQALRVRQDRCASQYRACEAGWSRWGIVSAWSNWHRRSPRRSCTGDEHLRLILVIVSLVAGCAVCLWILRAK